MSRRAIHFCSMLMLLATPALAYAGTTGGDAEAWSTSADAIRANGPGITLPMTVAGLSLSKSGDMSNGGKGIDNVAQYLSEDGAIQATLYVYRPGYADAALAAYMTDKAVMERFGARTRRTAYTSATAAGRSGTAIRAVYDDAADGALTTAAAFVQSGEWMVKLRVTGPSDQRKAVLAGLDGMIAALQVDDPARLAAVTPARIAPCAAPSSANCLRGTVDTAEGRYDLIQRSVDAVIVPMDDAGTTLSFDRAASDQAYILTMRAIGETRSLGSYATLPTTRQIAAIIDGADPRMAGAKANDPRAANAR